MFSCKLYHYRHNNEIGSVDICTSGNKFYVDPSGEHFNTINDLILHYKNHPLTTDKGVYNLDQV